jgi:hypothetical protein
LFGPSQKGTICSSDMRLYLMTLNLNHNSTRHGSNFE